MKVLAAGYVCTSSACISLDLLIPLLASAFLRPTSKRAQDELGVDMASPYVDFLTMALLGTNVSFGLLSS